MMTVTEITFTKLKRLKCKAIGVDLSTEYWPKLTELNTFILIFPITIQDLRKPYLVLFFKTLIQINQKV